jgi:hypothetical protein
MENARRDRIQAEAARCRTLDDLIRELREIGREGSSRSIVDVVVQDEYSHDVVVRWDDGVYVVYGTT